MRVFYYKDKSGNFGDDLNEWLWKELWPELPEDRDDKTLLVGIGTIIGLKLPAGQWRKLVMGSGVGYLNVPKLDDSWEFLAVRGPLSAKALGLKPEIAVTDAAALLRTLPQYAKPPKGRSGTVFMPHLTAKTGNWDKVCRKAGITYLDPQWDSKELLGKIQNAELVLADAMHAAICADTLRVRWVPLAISVHINTFKWMDWTQSLQLPYRPTYLPASGLIEWLTNKLIGNLTLPYRAPMAVIEEMDKHPERIEQLMLQHQMRGLKYSGWQRKLLKSKEWLLWKVLARALKLWHKSPLRVLCVPVDYFMIANAARALKTAQKKPSYLSNEKALDAAAGRLAKVFEKLKTASRKK